MKLSKVYEPGEYESKIYSLWEKSEIFKPSGTGKPYSIVMPPPNANADLHIGYELTAVLEDVLARYHRLKGNKTLLLPGADHAGFETWVVYEKQLAKEGKSRFDFTREQLYEQVWDFVAKNRKNFEAQLRRMGISCDWSRFTFTLDKKIVNQAYKTFKKMWDEGLIYRGERLINFCTFHGTAFADIEVEYKEEQGNLWYIKYPLTDGNGSITVATTRPETMLGDTAVAVSPSDDRYKKFIGKTVELPLTKREIPIIADEFVDKKFGTGAVKITPAHDPNDFEAGQRHDLPMITVIDNEGKMTNVSERYRGLTVKAARQKIVEDLDKKGFLEKTEKHVHSVGHCYKCGNVIEPLLREQWFIDMKPLADSAIGVLKEDKIKFYPESKKDQLITYLEHLKDWNISRQIAWGIPIPAFQNTDDPDDWVYDERVEEEIIEIKGKTYHRDPDVFDTWFSSSSWPYATLEIDSKDFKDFYPLSLMETGGEILYPWVSRMIMLGLYTTGKVPFDGVYIHGYVMAEDGAKMSKSLGNVVNPMPVIDKYGSDALRMGIIAGRAPAVNRGYDQRKIEDARNFCNKLWNVARFTESALGENFTPGNPKPELAADHWILTRLQQCHESINDDMDNYRFALAYERLYHFVWDDFADWYIEASKTKQTKQLLSYLLERTLILAHPFAPFVTESIWQELNWEPSSILAVRQLEKIIDSDKGQAKNFDELQKLVTEIRNVSKALNIVGITLYSSDEFVIKNSGLIKKLANLETIKEAREGEGLVLTTTKFNCWLDVDPKLYDKSLTDKKAKIQKNIDQLKKRLSNKSYVQNAPNHIVEQTKREIELANLQLTSIEQDLNRLR